jgi:uncharacterized repeat protein (TIGR04076 family)
MSKENELRDDQFELYDLEIVVERINGNCTCNMTVGDTFYLKGGKISMPDKSDFCLYALQSTIPLLPTKQRKNNPADWMETDSQATCPDPACGLIMNINRSKTRVLNHDDVSPIKWEKDSE